ncbi:sarcosine oxidase, gamma subunit [Marinovum sp.]|uniref:sarcosine oxidase subunit gamma n=1 Tax=Marinovum sp. TaxID=2024839 RepID=UPI002B26BB86|nr:sarcosine oxidase, gamma subunit [Marinovum sp.]
MIAVTALGGATAQIDDFDGLRISECPDWALASLAARLGREAELAEAAARFLGAGLPEVGCCGGVAPFGVFWIGPEQWMIEAPHASHEDLAAQVKAAVGSAGSVTEQSDGWVRFDLEGVRCHDVLELCCNADSRAMAVGAVTRTRIEHLGCFLIRRGTGHFSVLGPRSSAGSLHHALVGAAKSAI